MLFFQFLSRNVSSFLLIHSKAQSQERITFVSAVVDFRIEKKDLKFRSIFFQAKSECNDPSS